MLTVGRVECDPVTSEAHVLGRPDSGHLWSQPERADEIGRDLETLLSDKSRLQLRASMVYMALARNSHRGARDARVQELAAV